MDGVLIDVWTSVHCLEQDLGHQAGLNKSCSRLLGHLEQSKSSFSCTILITKAYVCLNYSGLVASNNFYLIRPGDPDLALNNEMTSIHQLEPHPYHLEHI